MSRKNWIKLIRFIKDHRKNGDASFDIVTNSHTFVITVKGCENTEESWETNMLRLEYK